MIRTFLRTFLVGTLIVGGLAVPPAFSEKATVPLLRAQEALKVKGYYTGETHGTLTNETRDALSRYQFDQRLEINGKLDRETVERLGGDVERASNPRAATPNEHFATAGQDIKTGYGSGGKKMGQGFADTGHEWGQGNIGQGFGAMGKGIGTGVADMGVGTGKAVWNSGKGIGTGTQQAVENAK